MCSTYFGYCYIHHQELATILLNYHIGRIVLGSMCVGVSVWFGWSGIRVAGCFRLQHGCTLQYSVAMWFTTVHDLIGQVSVHYFIMPSNCAAGENSMQVRHTAAKLVV